MRVLDPQSLTKHVDRLYRAAWALCGSREDAEDLVQETFVRVLAKPRVLQGDDELYYLMRVLRNTFLTNRRTASRRPVTVADLDEVLAVDGNPTGQPETMLEVHEVYSTIAELPEDARLSLVAVDVLGLSYRDAARALRVREATLTTRLFRARNEIIRRLAPERAGGDGAAGAESGSAGRAAPGAGASRHPAGAQKPHEAISSQEKGAGGVLPSGRAR